jgi:hypothetical protein
VKVGMTCSVFSDLSLHKRPLRPGRHALIAGLR